jgi:cob(I)alamin adenosyltransferase
MKIYTKTGDTGETGLLAGPRVVKCHARVEAYGAVDELNAFLGLARAEPLPADIDVVLDRVQRELFVVGAELACPQPEALGLPMIQPEHVGALERDIDHFEDALPTLKNFVLPRGVKASAALHVARTVCRRAERRVVALLDSEPEPISNTLLIYLNRLGDLLFSLARAANYALGEPEQAWRPSNS